MFVRSLGSMISVTFALVALGAGRAWGVEDCGADGRHVNLNHGGMTEHLTGVVRCVDRDSGKPAREIPYVRGKVHGTEKIFGLVRLDATTVHTEYREGRKHGSRKVFDPEGRLVSETTFIDDRELGLSRDFHPNGKIRREVYRTAENATTLVVEYDAEGRVAHLSCGTTVSMPIGRGERRYRRETGAVRTFFPDGRPREILSFADGLLDGKTETYAADGKLVRREELRGGKLHGVTELYREQWDTRTKGFLRGGHPTRPSGSALGGRRRERRVALGEGRTEARTHVLSERRDARRDPSGW